MIDTLKMFGALFGATFLYVVGNNLLGTLLGARMTLEGFSTTMTGLVLSGYFSGLLLGSFVCHRLVQRIGHIRAFAVFAATTTAAALLHGLCLSFWFWGFLRFFSGIAAFGIFMVIESWLNECCEAQNRGRVFSIYMILMYLGAGIGQQLLNIGDIKSPTLFIISGIVFALCLIPVSTTQGVHPRLPETKPYHFKTIYQRAPISMLGCLAAGLTNSAFHAMMPVFCTAIGLSLHQLAWIMTIAVFSGLAAQWLVGFLSDRFDRIRLLTIIAVAIAGISGVLFLSGQNAFLPLALEMGVFGALIFSVYPLSVARAHDIFEGQDAVAVSAGLLFAYSIGASASPFIAGGVMTLMDSPRGLYLFWMVISSALVVVTLYLRQREKIEEVPVEEQVVFVPMKNTSPVIMVLDPRTDTEDGNV